MYVQITGEYFSGSVSAFATAKQHHSPLPARVIAAIPFTHYVIEYMTGVIVLDKLLSVRSIKSKF